MKKISLAEMRGRLSKNEMKKIMAGTEIPCNGVVTCTPVEEEGIGCLNTGCTCRPDGHGKGVCV